MNDEVGILLMKAVMIEADFAAINRPGATPAVKTRVAVEAAFRFAIHNNLIVVNDPEDWPFILERVPE